MHAPPTPAVPQHIIFYCSFLGCPNPLCKLFGIHSFLPFAGKLWNSLPLHVLPSAYNLVFSKGEHQDTPPSERAPLFWPIILSAVMFWRGSQPFFFIFIFLFSSCFRCCQIDMQKNWIACVSRKGSDLATIESDVKIGKKNWSSKEIDINGRREVMT